jgi:hypothetical protein
VTVDGVTLEGIALTLQLFGFLDWLITSLTFAFILGACLVVAGTVGIVWSRLTHARRVVDVGPDMTAGAE